MNTLAGDREPAARRAGMLALGLLASAIALAEYARGFQQLGARWSFLAAAAVLTVCALGVRRGAEWARVLGGILAVAAGAFGIVFPRLAMERFVTALDMLLPTIAIAVGAYALLPATRRELDRVRASRSAAKTARV